jgi:hypothetical protein
VFWRGCTGTLGAEGVCWSRTVYRVRRGKGGIIGFVCMMMSDCAILSCVALHSSGEELVHKWSVRYVKASRRRDVPKLN